jgi:hypothetical protein
MANIFFAGEKTPKEEAIRKLILKVSEYFDGRFDAFFTHDDGGSVLELMVEVPEPKLSIEDQISQFPPLFEFLPKWEGWRTVLTKVPPGYIDAVRNRKDWEDDDY